jgi:hypothetical protein
MKWTWGRKQANPPLPTVCHNCVALERSFASMHFLREFFNQEIKEVEKMTDLLLGTVETFRH